MIGDAGEHVGEIVLRVGALSGIVVECQAAVVEAAHQRGPARPHITEGLRELGFAISYAANFDVSKEGVYFGQMGNWKGRIRGFLTWIRGSRISVQALGLGVRGHRFRPDPGGRSEWSPHTSAGRPRSAPEAGAVF